ncbi:MAG: ParA family protein [Acidimicrobiia bacterium]|nr:ParA family protein [Acidimicrobiia bacterium]
MTVVAVVNQKGGVGKTTVVLGLAASAWAAGERVVVIDLDPQANATTGLGVFGPSSTVDDALAVDRPGSLAGVLTSAEWPDGGPQPLVASGTPALAVREPQLVNDPIGAQDRLAVAIEGLNADVVLIDCPPSLGLLTVNGLFAADRALVVTEPGAWASDGVNQIVRTVDRVASRRIRPIELGGIAVNKLGRTRDARYWHEQLVAEHGEACLPPIRQRAALPEAAAQSLPIHHLAPRPGAAEAAAEFDVLYRLVVRGEAPIPEPEPQPAPEPDSSEEPSTSHEIDLTVDASDGGHEWPTPAVGPTPGPTAG